MLNPYIAKQEGKGCISNYDRDIVFTQEKLNYSQFINDVSSNKLTDTQAVYCLNSPKLHYVWLFPKSKNDLYLETLFTKQNPYLKGNVIDAPKGWDNYVWVTNVDIIPPKIQSELKAMNVQLKSFYELQFHPIKDEVKWKLFMASVLWANRYPDFAVNVIKSLILHKYGGIYIGNSYQIVDYNKLGDLVCNYDALFIVNMEKGNTRLNGGFLGSSSEAIIIDNTINILYKNIFIPNSTKSYVQYPCTNQDRKIFTTGDVPLSISLAKNADKVKMAALHTEAVESSCLQDDSLQDIYYENGQPVVQEHLNVVIGEIFSY